ncbi:hypothetical protein NLG97_g8401 [Lecanicillium saksenae]|uniref:Uncharacterized protein n=1 Tax=Lecanicillium saksenae TaxID=468837 RepID=A0ACC1QIZ7_9HYPO|nr:hypothetical protein NLG97_g8401 [Lecanicillium saksenae]
MQLRGLFTALVPAVRARQAVADSLLTRPGPPNWIAIYTGDNVPTKPETQYWYTAYATAGSSSGSARVDNANLKDGIYNAYLLADNGYRVLAGPLQISYTAGSILSPVNINGVNKFAYQTNQPDDTNWIAVYGPGNDLKNNN